MSDIKEAMADTKNLAKQFRSVLQVAAALDAVGSLEQVTEERGKAAQESREDALEAEGDLVRVSEELEATQEELNVAKFKATQLVAEAEQKAQELMDNAEIRAGGMVATAQAQITGLKQQLSVSEKEHSDFIKVATNEQREMSERTSSIKSELAALEAKFRSPE